MSFATGLQASAVADNKTSKVDTALVFAPFVSNFAEIVFACSESVAVPVQVANTLISTAVLLRALYLHRDILNKEVTFQRLCKLFGSAVVAGSVSYNVAYKLDCSYASAAIDAAVDASKDFHSPDAGIAAAIADEVVALCANRVIDPDAVGLNSEVYNNARRHAIAAADRVHTEAMDRANMARANAVYTTTPDISRSHTYYPAFTAVCAYLNMTPLSAASAKLFIEKARAAYAPYAALRRADFVRAARISSYISSY